MSWQLIYGTYSNNNWNHWEYLWIDSMFNDDVSDWIDENIKNNYSVFGIIDFSGYKIYFENNNDLVAFKLKWEY